MKAEQPVSTDGATPAHLCPKCGRDNTVKMTLDGRKSDGHETWKCRNCEYTWDIYVGPIERRPEERIF